MADVRITMKDGTVQNMPDNGAPGGSYSQTVRYEGAFVIITDARDNQTAIPAHDVAEVYIVGGRRW